MFKHMLQRNQIESVVLALVLGPAFMLLVESARSLSWTTHLTSVFIGVMGIMLYNCMSDTTRREQATRALSHFFHPTCFKGYCSLAALCVMGGVVCHLNNTLIQTLSNMVWMIIAAVFTMCVCMHSISPLESEPLPQVPQSEPLPQVPQSEPLPQVPQSEPLPGSPPGFDDLKSSDDDSELMNRHKKCLLKKVTELDFSGCIARGEAVTLENSLNYTKLQKEYDNELRNPDGTMPKKKSGGIVNMMKCLQQRHARMNH